MSWMSKMPIKKVMLAGLLFAALTPISGAFAEAPLEGDMVKFVPSAETRLVPDTPFISADGQPIKLESFKGKTILLNFWATWCAPCVKELPSLDRLNADLGDESFEVVLVSIDRGGARVYKPFMEKLGITATGSAEDSKAALMRAMKAPGLPTTYLVAPDGNILGRLVGDAEWDSDAAKALIKYYTSSS